MAAAPYPLRTGVLAALGRRSIAPALQAHVGQADDGQADDGKLETVMGFLDQLAEHLLEAPVTPDPGRRA